MDMKKIGELIALQRKKLGYTQDELGNILNISGKAVSKWERGLSCPDASLMNRIAVELKISIAQLLDGKAADVALSSNALNGGTVPVPDCAECGNIEISEKEDGEIVSPYLFGNNLEHTRSSVCGGISAQMLKNRKFVGKPSAMEGVAEGWYAIGEKTFFSFGEPYTRHDEKHYHMHRKLECNAQTVSNFLLDEECGIGQHELYLSPDTVYEFAIVLKSTEETDLAVSLTGRWGKRTYAKAVLHLQKSDQWKRYVAFLSTDCGDADADLKYDDLSTLKEEYETCIESVEWARANIRLLRKQLGNDLSISLDEWNVWYGWYRPSCVADGIWTALMMHMIIGEVQTSGVGIACQFEAVNEGAIAVTPPRVYLTAAGQALALMKKHMNGILRFAGNFAVATEKEGVVTITVVNSSYDESKNVTFSPKKSEVKATLYEGKSLLPHSCFEVEELSVRTDEKTCEIKIPPHSIAIIQY